VSARTVHIRTVTAKGQVTIPAEIRRLLGVGPHGRVAFIVEEGRVTLAPGSGPMTLEDTFGAVRPRRRPEDFQALRDRAIEAHVQHVLDEMR